MKKWFKYSLTLFSFILLAGLGLAASQPVVAELFTATWCPHCPVAEQAISQLADKYGTSKLIVLEYHPLSDELGNQKAEMRSNYYASRGYPTMFINGEDKIAGAGTVPETLKGYESKLLEANSGYSGVTISMKGKIDRSVAQVEATISLDKKTSLAGMSYRWILFTKSIRGRKGIYKNVVMDISEVYSNIKPGTSKTVPVYFSLPSTATGDNWGVVLLIQNDSTKKIVAASSTLLLGYPEAKSK